MITINRFSKNILILNRRYASLNRRYASLDGSFTLLNSRYVSLDSRYFYHTNTLDHYENPRNIGSLNKENKNVGTGLVGAPACGDVMKLQISVDSNGIITNSKFKTFGCGSAIASSSYATEYIKGKNINEAINITNSDIAKYLNLPPVKLHCSMLAEDAIKSAIKDFGKNSNYIKK